MINIIAIDDEYSVLNLLPHIIDWNEYGCNLTKTFSSAETALDYIAQNDVDVVISDICMPNMSGIDFVQKLSALYPNITVVFLSAYKDFEYAKSAIKYGVFDYITKPLDFDELDRLLKRLSKSISIKQQMQNSYTIYEKQQILIDFISGKISSADFCNALNLDPEYSPENSPAATVTIKINGLVEFLKTKWAYGIDRLYSCLIRFLESDAIEVIPLTLSAHSADILMFSSQSPSCDSFARRLNETKENFCKICKDELTLDASIEICTTLNSLYDVKLSALGSETEDDSPQQKNANVMEKALEYINRHLSSDISLSDVAGSIYMSPYHFSRMFKAYQNETFSDFILKKRLEYAQTLLKTENYTVSQIAEMTGFMNRNYFHRVFKHNIGCTPKEYIQANKTSKE